MGNKTGKGEKTRRRSSANKNHKFRHASLRRLFFVGLGLAGIGIAIGYGAGFLLKNEGAGIMPVAATAPVSVPPPLLPEASNLESGQPLRAYEEALPREIIVQPSPPVEATESLAPKPVKEEIASVIPVPADRKPLPRIVLVMDDLGIDKPRTARTIRLPGPLTLSFMTYANGLAPQTKAARDAGHELWMHIPMEPGSPDVDPGPNVLLTGIPEEELLSSLKWNLAQFSGYAGINNHMGSRFTADMTGMMTIMRELKKRGLFFLDSVTTGKTVGRKAARKAGVPFAGRNVFIDDQDDVLGIDQRLKEVEKLARKTGIAIAIGHPREATLKVLLPWLEKIEERGFQLVPLSFVFKKP